VSSSGSLVCLPEGTPLDDAQKLATDSSVVHHDSGLPADAKMGCSFQGLTCATSVGSIVCNSLCFVTCTEALSQPAAEARCVAWGGHLASILSAADETCLHNAHPQAAWIGQTQAANQATTAAGWTWIAGQAVSYTNWTNGQPDDGDTVENNAENCAYKSTSNVWLDEPCTALYGFACR
jgi:hypothetical protein